jgi:flavin reductase (DIM6/NTAB) family NADH-FMN oxidoreductase RutF
VEDAPVNEAQETIGAALGRIVGGCSVLTTQHSGRSNGLLVSWVQQAAFDPPSVTVCLKQGRPAARLIDGSKRFLLNVIGECTTPVLKHFGRGFSLEEDAFSGLVTNPTEFGPMLMDCIAHLGCVVQDRVAVGDHDLYIAKVVAGGAVDGAKPLIHIRETGLAY